MSVANRSNVSLKKIDDDGSQPGTYSPNGNPHRKLVPNLNKVSISSFDDVTQIYQN